MNILIIGIGGFIGSHSARRFSELGHTVWGADITSQAVVAAHHYTQLAKDNTVFDDLFTQASFDICINASGSANVGFSYENPELDYALNVWNVQKLLSCIRKYQPKCRFINFSSAAIYGNPGRLPIAENTPCKPLSPYGFHKLQSEYLLKEYYKFFGLHTCSLRVFSAYGPGLRKQLFWDLHQKVQATPHRISLFGSGEESRDFIYIDDLLEIVRLVIEQASFEGDVFNVGNGQETPIKQAVETFLQAYSPQTSYVFSGHPKLGDPNNWQADISKLSEMGFVSRVCLEEGLNHYASWLRELS